MDVVAFKRRASVLPSDPASLATQAGKTALADVVVEARVIKFGRTLVPLHVDLRNVDGKLVAIAQVTYMRLER